MSLALLGLRRAALSLIALPLLACGDGMLGASDASVDAARAETSVLDGGTDAFDAHMLDAEVLLDAPVGDGFVGSLTALGTGCGDEALLHAVEAERQKQPVAAITFTVERPGASCQANGALGFGNLATETPTRVGDLYRTGSITKTFTAAVILQLMQEGKLSVTDPLETYVAGVPNGATITLRHLLSHTSGVFNYSNDTAIGTTKKTPEEIVAFAVARSPVFQPGAKWSYSNTNYILLGMIIEKLTGKTWASEVRRRLIDPQGLSETFIEGDEPVTGMVRGYAAARVDLTDFVDPSLSWAAGAVVASTRDVAKWGLALFSGKVLEPDTLTLMTTKVKLNSGSNTHWGLGVEIQGGARGATYGHGGQASGFQAQMTYYASDRSVFVSAGNDFGFKPDPVMNVLVEKVLPLDAGQ